MGTQMGLKDYGAEGTVAWQPRPRRKTATMGEEVPRHVSQGQTHKLHSPTRDSEKANKQGMEVLVSLKTSHSQGAAGEV